jgi:hypothetical protein
MQSQENKIKIIENNIKYLPDDIVSNIFNVMTYDKDNIKVNTISSSYRENRIKYIENNLDQLDQSTFATIENTIKTYLKEVGNKEKRKVHITTMITNKILDLNKTPNIKDLCDFKEVHRNILMSDECKAIFDFYGDEIYENAFVKTECITHKKKTRCPHISLYKNMLKNMGYNLVARTKIKLVDGKDKGYTTYYISKKQ